MEPRRITREMLTKEVSAKQMLIRAIEAGEFPPVPFNIREVRKAAAVLLQYGNERNQ